MPRATPTPLHTSYLISLNFVVFVLDGSDVSNESDLFQKLFKGYNKHSHPKKIENYNATVRVDFDFQLINILDVVSSTQFQ